MKCPFCTCEEDKVVDSRSSREGKAIRRRRECLSCGQRFTTYEYVETIPLTIVKADGRREPYDRQKILGGLGSVGNDFPINAAYPLFDDTIEQRAFDPVKAAEHYKASGHDGSPIVLATATGAFPGAVDAANLFAASANAAGIPLQVKLEPDDGYWSNVWNVAPFCASYWGGRPVQDQMYTTAYLSTADWNDTKFKRPDFDKLLLQARSELDEAKRKDMYRTMAMTVRDEGGVILPMFNDFVNASTKQVKGYVHDIGNDMSNGYVATRVWLDA